LNFCKIHHQKIALQFAEHKNKSRKNGLNVGGKSDKPVCRQAEKSLKFLRSRKKSPKNPAFGVMKSQDATKKEK